MLSSDERLLVGLKMIERLRSNWRNGHLQLNTLLQVNKPAQKPDTDDPTWPPNLNALLAQAGELSPYTILLGVCEDGLPFLLELNNPAPGALLISSDHGGGKTRLLRALLASACVLNTPQQVRINIMARDSKDFKPLVKTDHWREVVAFEPKTSSRVIQDLYSIAESRRHDRPEDPQIILAIDDLAACTQFLSEDDFTHLLWLMRHGARSFVWPIVTLSAEDAHKIHPRMMASLRTRLIGFIHDDQQAAFLSQDDSLDARWIEEGLQFYVPYGDQWLPFWICDPEADSSVQPSSQNKLPEANIYHAPTDPQDDTLQELLKSWNERFKVAPISAQLKIETNPPTELPSNQVGTSTNMPGETVSTDRSYDQPDPTITEPRPTSSNLNLEHSDTRFQLDPSADRTAFKFHFNRGSLLSSQPQNPGSTSISHKPVPNPWRRHIRDQQDGIPDPVQRPNSTEHTHAATGSVDRPDSDDQMEAIRDPQDETSQDRGTDTLMRGQQIPDQEVEYEYIDEDEYEDYSSESHE